MKWKEGILVNRMHGRKETYIGAILQWRGREVDDLYSLTLDTETKSNHRQVQITIVMHADKWKELAYHLIDFFESTGVET